MQAHGARRLLQNPNSERREGMAKRKAAADTAGRMAQSAAKATGKLVEKGRNKLEQLALQTKLARLHRQLGALVYGQQRDGTENKAMVAWYCGQIDTVKARLSEWEQPDEDSMSIWGREEAEKELENGAMFCVAAGRNYPQNRVFVRFGRPKGLKLGKKGVPSKKKPEKP